MDRLLICTVLLLGWAVSVAAYRIIFHPLAKYPGPLLGRLTGWRDWYYILKGNRHVELWRLHEIYGPVVRISPNALSINTPGALTQIYSNHKANVQKGSWYSFSYVFTNGSSNTHSEVDRDKHAVKRRLLSNAFSDKALRGMEKIITSCADQWCQSLGETSASHNEWTEPKNMADWVGYLTMDILGELCFAKSFECTTKPDNRYAPKLTDEMMQFVYIAGYFPLRWLIPPLFSNSRIAKILGGEQQQKFMKFSRDAFAERERAEREIRDQKAKDISSESGRKDFFSHLFKGIDPETGRQFSAEELAGESELLIIAGAGTTAVAMSTCVYCLINDRFGRLARLSSQIRETFSSVEEISYTNTKLMNLEYLRACIDESLRMAPPAPGHLPREVLEGGIMIDNMYIPTGTVVGVSSWALFHNEEYFPQAFSFIPERWIPTATSDGTEGSQLSISFSAESIQRAKSAFAPFSLGARGCIGKNLAYAEMMVVLAKLLWVYELEACEESEIKELLGPVGMNPFDQRTKEWGVVPGNYRTDDIFVSDKEPVWLRLKKRVPVGKDSE
ncbi:cytochrome P450 [Xylogone sp. PMI_703]|nr:cytochrome P450 [Xylogone sp. PMI_703]